MLEHDRERHKRTKRDEQAERNVPIVNTKVQTDKQTNKGTNQRVVERGSKECGWK